MQQATAANDPNTSAPSGNAMPPDRLRNLFVINLCGSTTPVALTPPDHAGLKRFTFFVSRRREEGRERFRLHMGYFESQEEAEKLLDIVREIYPGAWAGLSPGLRLRAKAQADAKAAAATAPIAASAPVTASVPVTESVPVAQSAPSAESTPLAEPALALLPDEGRRVSALPAAAHKSEAAALALSNVRAAIASLEDTNASAPTLAPLPELKAPAASEAARELSDSAALSVLESDADAAGATTVNQPRLPAIDQAAAPQSAESAVPKASAGARPRDEKTAYAVQLLWSVQPIDIAQIPQLAIFSAYTLYGAEGNRDGRRWYGVRLGFFTDAVSAKQVAHYVRSDFSTVSVVPVTVRERERAKLASTRPDATPVAAAAPAAAPAQEAKPVTSGFEFIEDKPPPPVARPAGAGDESVMRPARGAPGKRAKLRAGRQVNGRGKSKPMTLEETLEILGAGKLEMDDGRRALINDSAPRAPSPEPAKGRPSRFGRLLERLSERLG